MGSWTLFRTFFAWKTTPTTQSPIFKRESNQPLIWQSRWTLTHPPIPVSLIIFALVVAVITAQLIDVPLVTRCANLLLMLAGPLVLLLPSLVLWVIPLGLVFARVIVRERSAGNWELLRTTPFNTEELLLQKAGGALWRLRGLLSSLGNLQAQVLAAILLSLGMIEFLDTMNTLPESRFGGMDRSVLCIGGLFVLLGIAGLFLLDRLQQLILMIVTALAMSASTRSMHMALTRTIAATFLVWLADVGAAVLALLAQPAGQVQDFGYSIAATVMMGPMAGYLIALPPLSLIVLVLATFVIREFAVHGLWRFALHGAQQL